MTFDKRIITHHCGAHDELTFSNGFVISGGSCGRNIAFLLRLAAEAKRDFPDIRDENIEVFIITRSSYNQGFAGVRFPLPKNAVKEGYRQANAVDFQY